jgi:hypothetical protein
MEVSKAIMGHFALTLYNLMPARVSPNASLQNDAVNNEKTATKERKMVKNTALVLVAQMA